MNSEGHGSNGAWRIMRYVEGLMKDGSSSRKTVSEGRHSNAALAEHEAGVTPTDSLTFERYFDVAVH
jgi:hypothetical protein